MTTRELVRELRRHERRIVRAIEIYDAGDIDDLGQCLVNFGEAFEELVEAVEAEGVSA
jgi:hypothetical protein